MPAVAALVVSLEEHGVLREATLGAAQVAAEDSLLALRVDGEGLPRDHGTRGASSRRPCRACTAPGASPGSSSSMSQRYGASPMLLAHIAAFVLLPVLDAR